VNHAEIVSICCRAGSNGLEQLRLRLATYVAGQAVMDWSSCVYSINLPGVAGVRYMRQEYVIGAIDEWIEDRRYPWYGGPRLRALGFPAELVLSPLTAGQGSD